MKTLSTNRHGQKCSQSFYSSKGFKISVFVLLLLELLTTLFTFPNVRFEPLVRSKDQFE